MYSLDVNRKLPELLEIEGLIDKSRNKAQISIISHVELGDQRLPIHKIIYGSKDPTAPVLALFGGVHGLERIGTQVVCSIMRTMIELLKWDEILNSVLEHIRIVFVPLVNPGGMMLKKRANPRGIDLMRNAPVDAGHDASFLVGGHRISPRLPWYQGELGAPMEIESLALIQACKEELFSSRLAISLDFHSGFGTQDQIWFPYAKSVQSFYNLPELFALKQLLDHTYPNHFYKIEPQSKYYRTHGDLWDYLYDEFQQNSKGRVFLPLTLEMGSWLWVRKNPKQFFSALGPFNPILPHRKQRVLRRHNTLFDFLIRALRSPDQWSALDLEERRMLEKDAKALWYGI